MKVWAIKHKPTGEWMPTRMSKTARGGWSYWEPGIAGRESGYEGYDKHPRIFFTHRAAINALTMWLAGRWVEQQTRGSYFEPPESDGLAPCEPLQERRREDMEIVELELVGA